MFHYSHQLDCVIAQVPDAWKDVLGEFLVCANTMLGSRDADVSLVNA